MEDKSSSTVTDCTSKVYFEYGNKKLSIGSKRHLQQAKFWWWEGIVRYFVSEF